jgi:hypothetical protein
MEWGQEIAASYVVTCFRLVDSARTSMEWQGRLATIPEKNTSQTSVLECVISSHPYLYFKE